MKEISQKEKIKIYMLCCLVAFLILSICSKCSFLYPLNNWGDAGCYYVQGRGILVGLVPYRDMAEQKGPAIFFVYALGELVSKSSFIGIFIIEIICAATFLFFSIRIAGLFYSVKSYELGIAAILAASVYGSYVNRHGGGPEEMSLALFSFMLYLAVRYISKDLLPSVKEMIFLGIYAGLLFWTKYTLCALYIALLLIMLVHSIIRHEMSSFWKKIIYFVLGCIIISFPIIFFFAINGSLMDLFMDYFYNNIFLYRKNDTIYMGFWGNMKLALSLLLKARNAFSLILIILGSVWMLMQKKYELFIGLLASFLFAFIILNSGIAQKYSNLPLFVFCGLGFCPIIGLLNTKKLTGNFLINIIIVVCAMIGAYVFCLHTHDLLKKKSEMPQYAFSSEMKSYGIDNYSMLYYGVLDEGYYFADGQMPKWRAFVQLNQGGSELKNLQNGYINKQEPDFIISEKMLCDSSDYDIVAASYEGNAEKEVVSFDDFGYEMIDEKSFYYEEYNHVVRLYKRK
ncbi:glycosyltransferase family 39 protein [Butyrivibrio sp. AE3004]|uniref:glycosyltransferase family 39 protein n=1 Tax=Butyrivibrio sp. AE3004 TaxID=1506994 RepID=UPI0004945D26|nr:glycosyltransferase family 39 protein [Butyrivibrio sp. AE3004]